MNNTNQKILTPQRGTKKRHPPTFVHVRLIALAILLMLPMLSFAKSLTVSADRQTIEMGDIITLTIRADFQTRGSQLDLDRLKDQFEILGRQQSNQISIINGQFSSQTQWQISLMAKQVGELIVPPLRIEGVESKPYKIKVLPPQKKSAKARGNYFLETNLNKQKVYVQEELLYDVKFYFLGAFQGNLRPPTFENSLTVTLKEQEVYGKQVNGKHYTVYEWLYAVYPQQSGTLTIKGPIFSGIHQYLNRQKGVQEVAETQTVTVLPEPIQLKSNPNNPWLPATSLTLSDRWQTIPSTLRVGDSLTRTLTLEVQGLLASQLITPTFENSAEFKVYNDQPTTDETLLDSGVQSQLQLTQTFILTQSGTVTIPEQQIEWFNTQTQQMETARLKARYFTVLPALNAPTTNPTNTPTDRAHNQNSNQSGTPFSAHNQNSVSRETTSLLWPTIGTLLSLAWLITLILWRREVKKLKHQAQQTVQTTEKTQTDTAQKITLCASSSHLTPRAFYNELRRVLQQEYQINSFSELEDTHLKQAINQLEKHLFYQEELAENTLTTICEGLEKLTDKISPPPSHKESKLASLYENS